MIADLGAHVTIMIAAHIEKTSVRHLPSVRVFIVFRPSQPIVDRHSPFRIAIIANADPF